MGYQATHSRNIDLRSEGSVTVTISVDLMVLRGDDRDFIMQLIDVLDAYEEAAKQPGLEELLRPNLTGSTRPLG